VLLLGGPNQHNVSLWRNQIRNVSESIFWNLVGTGFYHISDEISGEPEPDSVVYNIFNILSFNHALDFCRSQILKHDRISEQQELDIRYIHKSNVLILTIKLNSVMESPDVLGYGFHVSALALFSILAGFISADSHDCVIVSSS